MKIERLISLSAAVLVLGGCSPHDQSVKAKEPDPSLTVRRDAGGRVNTNPAIAPEAPADPREELVALAGNQLREMDARIAELARRAEAFKADARTQADRALLELRRRRDAVADQIDALETGSAASLPESRARVATALSEWKRLYESVWLKLDERDAAPPKAIAGGLNPPKQN